MGKWEGKKNRNAHMDTDYNFHEGQKSKPVPIMHNLS